MTFDIMVLLSMRDVKHVRTEGIRDVPVKGHGWRWTGLAKSNTKRIMISLPHHLLQEVDGVAQKEKSNRSELIRQAMSMYLKERKKRYIRETMQKGYMEMGKINLKMASEAFEAEEEADLTLDRLVSGV
jgi:CopG family transcriptional regulator/antitoxin EndoAI